MIPYGKQFIDEQDIQAVVAALRSDWLTTGPAVKAFEDSIAGYVGTRFATAVSSGTAALHSAMSVLGVTAGDEVIVPTMTFAATANCVVYLGATPVFADVQADTLLIDPDCVERLVTSRTKAIISVDFAGQPCDYDALNQIAKKHRTARVSDACHALGAEYKGNRIGSLSDMTVFSFHPVKHITTGEGGMVVTDREDFHRRLNRFRNHGISMDFRQREARQSWYYEITDLGYNYRITDIQCALGISQLRKLPNFIKRRNEIARRYTAAFIDIPEIEPLLLRDNVCHAWHLYVVRINHRSLPITREELFNRLRTAGIGVNVHYIPVHLHPFYRRNYSTGPGMCPVAESAYENILSLPIHPMMHDKEVDYVIDQLNKHIFC